MKSEQLTCRQPSELDAHSKKLDISVEAKNTLNSRAQFMFGALQWLREFSLSSSLAHPASTFKCLFLFAENHYSNIIR